LADRRVPPGLNVPDLLIGKASRGSDRPDGALDPRAPAGSLKAFTATDAVEQIGLVDQMFGIASRGFRLFSASKQHLYEAPARAQAR